MGECKRTLVQTGQRPMLRQLCSNAALQMRRFCSTAPETAPEGQRITKYLSRLGYCSRRQAEEWIKKGMVQVNGETITKQGVKIDPETDKLTVESYRIVQSRQDKSPRVWLYHGPRRVITSRVDELGRPTVYELVAKNLRRLDIPPHFLSVGRLDYDSEGLLLLTTCGQLKRWLELPKGAGFEREYLVRAHAHSWSNNIAKQMERGVTVEGTRYGPIKAAPEQETHDANGPANRWFRVKLAEGKNRELRKVFAHFGMPLSRVRRVAYGPIQIPPNLKRGQAIQMDDKKVRALVKMSKAAPGAVG